MFLCIEICPDHFFPFFFSLSPEYFDSCSSASSSSARMAAWCGSARKRATTRMEWLTPRVDRAANSSRSSPVTRHRQRIVLRRLRHSLWWKSSSQRWVPSMESLCCILLLFLETSLLEHVRLGIAIFDSESFILSFVGSILCPNLWSLNVFKCESHIT